MCRFSTPLELISDNGTQFSGARIDQWCRELQINQKFSSVAHPQTNGQTEVMNRIILKALKTHLGMSSADWANELLTILWNYRVTPNRSLQESPFSLTYDTDAVIPPQILEASYRIQHFEPDQNEEDLMIALEMIDAKRVRAAIREETLKTKIA